MTNNAAFPGHPVIREISRRKAEGADGNSPAARKGSAKLGLVVEGGAMRGVYSGGALVALEELGLSDVFDCVYGESAGAINACYFLAHQGAFGIRIYLDDLTSLKFVNPCRVGRILDVDYAIDVVVKKIKPLDVDRVQKSPSELFIAVTDAFSGQSRVIDVRREGIPLLPLLKASSAIVPLYNHAVRIDGREYVDGGIANPIPLMSAIQGGCTHILVLLTRPLEFAYPPVSSLQRALLSPLLRKWPAPFVQSFHERQSRRYNEARDLAFGRRAVTETVSIAVIGPTGSSPPFGRTTIGRSKLLRAMENARRRAREAFGFPA